MKFHGCCGKIWNMIIADLTNNFDFMDKLDKAITIQPKETTIYPWRLVISLE